MRRIGWLSVVVVIISGVLVGFAEPALAEATRTWVSGVGDDANPCSRTAPCKTFAGAISKTAAGGEIDALDPGGFGAITITKAITIDGGGTFASILNSGTNGVIINAGATDTVILRNLSINGAGTGINGIRFIAGGTLIVDNSTIFNQGATSVDQGNGIDFNPNGASKIFVRRTSVRNNAGFGIYVRPQAGGTAVGTLKSVDANKNNTGIRVLDGATITAIDVESSGNSQNGFRTLSSGAALFLSIVDSVSTDNPNFGIKSEGALSVVHVSRTSVTKNGTGVNAAGGATLLSFTNNAVGANTTNGAFTGSIALS